MAYALKYINDFKGPCILQVRQQAIVIKNSNGTIIGSWPYNVIREFKFEDPEKHFMFTSGRRGPFGVANYLFDLHDRIYYSIRETVNYIAKGGNVAEPTPHRSSCRSPQSRMEGAPMHHVSGGSWGSGAPRVTRERRHHGGSMLGNDQYVPVAARDDSNVPPPIPPHATKKGKSQKSPSTLSILNRRSTSIPDLHEQVTRKDSTNSAKVSPVRMSNFRGSLASSSSSNGGDMSVCDSDDSFGLEHSPQPECRSVYNDAGMVKSDYQIPRNQDDSRNDYDVPRPVEKTYMAPRKVYQKEVRNLEHSYEDPDMFKDKGNTIKIIRGKKS